MRVAKDLLDRIIDIDDASKEIEYHCIHCNCEMIPSALNSLKVSPYFRAKQSHDIECSAKLIDTRQRYNSKESDIEDIYERLLILETKDTIEREEIEDKNSDRNRKDRKNIKIKYLSQLVSYCVGNDINIKVGDRFVKDFFVDKRTYKDFKGFKENELYLLGARYKGYSTPHKTMYFMAPIGVRAIELGIWFKEESVYFNVKDKIFKKDSNDEYKDIYVLALGTKTGKLKIYSGEQFYFVDKNKLIDMGDENE